jgi:predicted alpha/beta superfamily hydrolase
METSPLLPGVVLHELHSSILDQDMYLYVKLPWSYERTQVIYPVLFCLDANRTFPIYATTSLIYENPAFGAREIVIVGVGYKVDQDRPEGLAQWGAWRTRDLTPVSRPDVDSYWQEVLSKIPGGQGLSVLSGGAPRFLDCLLGEVLPHIEANFRISAEDRGLAGYSYGGLFTLYALFHAPEAFQRYFAGSPSMWDVVFEYEQAYAASHMDLPAKLLMTAGNRETDLLERFQRMADNLESRGYPGLEMQVQIIEGEGHVSGGVSAISRALGLLYYQDVFNR